MGYLHGNGFHIQDLSFDVHFHHTWVAHFEWECRVLGDLRWDVDPDSDVGPALACRLPTYYSAYPSPS